MHTIMLAIVVSLMTTIASANTPKIATSGDGKNFEVRIFSTSFDRQFGEAPYLRLACADFGIDVTLRTSKRVQGNALSGPESIDGKTAFGSMVRFESTGDYRGTEFFITKAWAGGSRRDQTGFVSQLQSVDEYRLLLNFGVAFEIKGADVRSSTERLMASCQ